MKEIVINTNGMGLRISYEAVMEYAKRKGIKLYPCIQSEGSGGYRDFDGVESDHYYTYYFLKPLNELGIVEGDYFLISDDIHDEYSFNEDSIARDDKDLVAIIKEFKSRAFCSYHEFKVVEIPDDVDWYIETGDEYMREWVEERHRSWY